MIYKNQLFRPIAIGERVEGYVRRITEDNRIDITLQRDGYGGVSDSADVLVRLMQQNGGVLPIGDNSTPEEVHRLTQMSKKVFKRAVGVLMKRGDIVAEPTQIKLK
jgi:predicted RNA-binding protein (virulence factor B family)